MDAHRLDRRIVRWHDRFTVSAADPDILRSQLQVPSGEVWRINRYAFRLETDEAGLVRSFIDSGGDLHFLNEWPAPANPFLYVDDTPFLMGEGERLALEVSTVDLNDIIHLIYSGVVVQNPGHVDEPPIPELEA